MSGGLLSGLSPLIRRSQWPVNVGGSDDEDAFRSPLEMEAEARKASSCSANAGACGDTGVAIANQTIED